MRAKFCGCKDEPAVRRGLKVFVKSPGVLTLNEGESTGKKCVGTIDGKLRLKLNDVAEKALSLI